MKSTTSGQPTSLTWSNRSRSSKMLSYKLLLSKPPLTGKYNIQYSGKFTRINIFAIEVIIIFGDDIDKPHRGSGIASD